MRVASRYVTVAMVKRFLPPAGTCRTIRVKGGRGRMAECRCCQPRRPTSRCQVQGLPGDGYIRLLAEWIALEGWVPGRRTIWSARVRAPPAWRNWQRTRLVIGRLGVQVSPSALQFALLAGVIGDLSDRSMELCGASVLGIC